MEAVVVHAQWVGPLPTNRNRIRHLHLRARSGCGAVGFDLYKGYYTNISVSTTPESNQPLSLSLSLQTTPHSLNALH
ncbi:hypothetical protein VNO77_43613 [Canavalia gladiata]|uniref:Uncharacterized protein n=1 Tax=Canavalia gladiata TaxID=3824 RepID=A0AAN9PQ71_CANGL